MESSNLLSGIIGALIGVTATIVLYWHSRYISAKRALADKLIILRHDVWWNCNDSEIFKTWDASLKEIWLLYNAVFDFAPFWKKKHIQNGWEKYKGEDHKIMEKSLGDVQVFDTKRSPKNKQEFLQNITSMIASL